MKKTLLLLSIIFCSIHMTGQGVWAPHGATWYYSYDNFWITGYVKIQNIGDTIIDSKTCNILEKKRYTYDCVYLEYDSSVIGYDYTYIDSNIVYYHRFNEFYKLYDFNLDAGDYWTVAGWESSPCDSTGEIKVDSIGNQIINSFSLKYQYVNLKDTSDWCLEGKIIERIGPLYYMFPEPYCVMDLCEGGMLRCYYDSLFGLYQTGSSSCDFIVGFNEQQSDNNNFTIYPNPATTTITIELNKPLANSSFFELYSIVGQRLKTIKSEDKKIIVDMTELTNGVYYLYLQDINNSRIIKKIILNAL